MRHRCGRTNCGLTPFTRLRVSTTALGRCGATTIAAACELAMRGGISSGRHPRGVTFTELSDAVSEPLRETASGGALVLSAIIDGAGTWLN